MKNQLPRSFGHCASLGPLLGPAWGLGGRAALLLTAVLALEGTLASLLVGRGDFLICSKGPVKGTFSLGSPSHLGLQAAQGSGVGREGAGV